MGDPASRAARAFDWLWVLVCGVVSSLGCLAAAPRLGATFDEPLYLERGLQGWREGSHRPLLRLGTMPLPIDVQTLPLYLYEKATGTTLNAADCERLLPWTRGGTLVFWWLLLTYGWLAGRRLAGPWGGRLAVAVLACEPNLLAHASLATTDIAVSAALLALVYHFDAGRGRAWPARVGLPAFWFAVAILCKASGLVFGPIALAAVALVQLLRDRATPLGTASAPVRRDLLQIGIVGLLLAFVLCGSDWQAEASFVRWAHDLSDGPLKTALVALAENLRVFSNAGDGLVRQVRHNVRGHGVFLLGEVHPRALWYYFPTALAIKLPLPLLLLLGGVLALRPRALLNPYGVAAAALLLFSLTCRVQIGIRLVLPLVALAAVGGAAASVEVARTWRRLGPPTLAGVVGWMALGSALVWPHGLGFANELWGGSDRTYLYLSDSNFDWGQGLKDLQRWRRQRGLERVDVWYFGTDPARTAPTLREVPLHAVAVDDIGELRRQLGGRYLAVGATLVYGMATPSEPHRRAAAILRGLTPVDRAGTFLIYDFGEEGADKRDAY